MNREQFIDVYADHVIQTNNDKRELNAFVNAQVELANNFYKRLVLKPGGKERLREITGASKRFTKQFYAAARKDSKQKHI
jgi:hypothetical protein